MEIDFSVVNKAFTAQAPDFDGEDESNPILQWMRIRVMKHAEQFLQNGNSILELNAGTGIDASYLARSGYKIHATDLSDGMTDQMKKKIERFDLYGRMTVQQLSFTDLNNVQNAPFDFVFSNFGGLNCIPSLTEVAKNISCVLKHDGFATLVIMPPICPWEIASALKGNFRQAFRRLKNRGSIAHIEGERFMTYYFTPSEVRAAFGKNYRLVALEGLASFCPPPYKKQMVMKHPHLFKWLKKRDEQLNKKFPFSCWADHFIITLQYLPDRIIA